MSDPFRTDASRAIDARSEADRDGKIEQLLLDGLDHYFAAQYERAINIWTRALFFDHGHPRARAYIERARSALAERQRESEELLEHGVAAFHRGERDEARRLLLAAIDGGAPPDEAHVLLDRLNRDHRVGVAEGDAGERPPKSATTSPPARAVAASRSSGTISRRISGVIVAALAAGVIAVGVYWAALGYWVDWRSLVTGRDAPVISGAAPAARDVTLSVPRRGEMALARARSLAASGRFHDALTLLDLVRPTDPEKADADGLRTNIQRQLLGLAPSQAPSSAIGEKGDGRLP